MDTFLNSLFDSLQIEVEKQFEIPFPRYLVFAVTYDCNSRCRMCNIWKKEKSKELSERDILSILKKNRPFLSKLRMFQITGGEAFLKDGLLDIIECIIETCPSLDAIGIPTNGYLTERIVRLVKKVLDSSYMSGRNVMFHVGVSLDGSRDIHDEQRGINGAFDKAIATIKALKELEDNDNHFILELQCTITKLNILELYEVLKISRELNCRIEFTPAITSSTYYGNLELERNLDLKPYVTYLTRFYNDLLRTDNTDPIRKYFVQYFYEDAVSIMKGNFRRIPCTAGSEWLFIDPRGNVYPCNVLGENFKMGNVTESNLRDILTSYHVSELRKKLRTFETCRFCLENCGLICNVKCNPTSFLSYLVTKHPSSFIMDTIKSLAIH